MKINRGRKMGENAELWSRPDEVSQRRTVISWLKSHKIKFDYNETTENLIQLYRDIECGKYGKVYGR